MHDVGNGDTTISPMSTTCLRTSWMKVEHEHNEVSVEIPDDMKLLRQACLEQGPLNEDELKIIWSRIDEPMLTLAFKEGCDITRISHSGYPVSAEKQAGTREIIGRLLNEGVIEQVPIGSGQFTAAGFCTKKSNSTKLRLVVDYSILNERLVRPFGAFHHSSADWCWSIPSHCIVYGKLDIKDAFYTLPISEESKKYLHMRVHGLGEFKFHRMPQGLCLSTSLFTDYIETVLSSIKQFVNQDDRFKGIHIIPYVDDLLVAGSNEVGVRSLMLLIRQCLAYGHLYIADHKFVGPTNCLHIMGVQLRGGYLGPADEKIARIRKLSRPKSRDELRSVLGLLSYCRVSIRPPTLLVPLQEMLTNKKHYSWTPAMEEAWLKIVPQFDFMPIRHFSINHGDEDPNKWHLVLQSDASETALSYAVWIVDSNIPPENLDIPTLLSNEETTNKIHLLDIGMRKFSSAERKYSTHDREGLAIYHNIAAHKALIHIFPRTFYQADNVIALCRFRNKTLGDPNRIRGQRWLRWLNDLQDLLYLGDGCPRISFLHIPGPDNGICDYLSRYIEVDLGVRTIGTQTENAIEPHIVLVTSANHIFDGQLKEALKDWSTDSDSQYNGIPLQMIKEAIETDEWFDQQGPNSSLTSKQLKKLKTLIRDRFKIIDDHLHIFCGNSSQICVPNSRLSQQQGNNESSMHLRTYLIYFLHEGSITASHRGMHSVLSALRKNFWWPRMDLSVQAYIGSCVACVAVKGQEFEGTTTPRYIGECNQLVVLDFAGPLFGRYVLVAVDAFSGFCNLSVHSDKSSKTVARGILHWCAQFGCPEGFAHDNEPSFRSEICNYLKSWGGTGDILSPTYSPQSQGNAERVVRLIKEAVQAVSVSNISDIEQQFDLLVEAIAFGNNSTPRHMGISPFLVTLGRAPRTFLDWQFGSGFCHNDTITQLQDSLAELQSYWRSKSNELKCVRYDKIRLEADLAPGDNCVRICYLNGRRKILDTGVVVVSKVPNGNNTYVIRSLASGLDEICHGYQLCKLAPTSEYVDRRGLPTVSFRLSNIKELLPMAPVGTTLCWEFDGRRLMGELISPYTTGNYVDVIHYPRKKRPTNWEQHLERCHVGDIVLLNLPQSDQ
jgi:hypothetical protein